LVLEVVQLCLKQICKSVRCDSMYVQGLHIGKTHWHFNAIG
jgi:hypothetical protein